MNKKYLAIAALFGALAVTLGAFGAHGLQKITADEKILHGFNTAVQYQMYHSLALLFVAIAFEKFPAGLLKWAASFFIIGIILFSGSLYFLTFLKTQNIPGANIAGPVTPLGGLSFIAGWLLLFIAAIRKK